MSNEAYKPGDWYCEQCNNHNFARRASCHRCGNPKTTGASFGASGWGGPQHGQPAGGMGGKGGNNVAREAGDWDCPQCCNMNFARRNECHRCRAPRPANTYQQGYDQGYGGHRGGGAGGYGGGDYRDQGYQQQGQGYDDGGFKRDGPPRGPDDWDCWICGNMNFARRMACKKCEYDKDKCLPKKGAKNARPGDWLCMECQSVNFADKENCFECQADRKMSSNERVLESLKKYAGQ